MVLSFLKAEDCHTDGICTTQTVYAATCELLDRELLTANWRVREIHCGLGGGVGAIDTTGSSLAFEVSHRLVVISDDTSVSSSL